MCEPASIMAGASLAIGAATAASKFSAAQEDAGNQRNYQGQVAYNAEVSRNLAWNQLTTRQGQESDAATQALTDNQTRALKARAIADASAGESGVQGNSVESVARDFYMQQDKIDSATVRNNAMEVNQLQMEKDSEQAKYSSRTSFPKVKDPSVLGLGLEIGGAAVGAYGTYDSIKNRRK